MLEMYSSKFTFGFKILFQPNFRLVNHARLYSVKSSKLFCEKMKNKCLIELNGECSASLLQGLITNDIDHLVSQSKAIYSMFLNNKGRVMFDTIIAKGHEDQTYFIECETKSAGMLEKHLKRYKLRKKVSIKLLEADFNIYSIFDLNEIISCLPNELVLHLTSDKSLEPILNANETISSLDNLNFSNFLAYRDPRLSALGYRVIVPKESDLKELNPNLNDPGDIELYRLCRYCLGLVEGEDEIPYEQCFPLETNCDYLHGVSFHKGCYIGQELTARSHHTGVIRKRIMPLILDIDSDSSLSVDITDGTESNKKVGKLRGRVGKFGVGLLRVSECMKLHHLHTGKGTACCFKPLWWPQETLK